MYIGSCVTVHREMLVCDHKPTAAEDVSRSRSQIEDGPENEIDLGGDFNEDGETNGVSTGTSNAPKFVTKKIKYNAGLFKLFGEAQSNAVDNKWRSEAHAEASASSTTVMKKIDFTCDGDPESEWYGYIGVVNDGYCIPVEQAEYEYEDYRTGKTIKELLYPAEVFFGEMLAGTNFEEDENRKTSGRNGMGAKTDNVFSNHLIVDHTNPEQGKRFYQEYSDHGKVRTKPKITSYSGKTGYTSVFFHPDYPYFNYPGMDADLIALCKRYAYETAMITGLQVTFNGEKLAVKGLEKFVRMIYPDAKENCMVSFLSPTGDECVLVEKGIPEMDQLEDVAQHSWINGINTKNGGTHVAAWRDALFPALVKTFNARRPKKGEKTVLKASAKEMYPYFTLFVRCEVGGPKFDGQPKDMLVVPEVFDLYGEEITKADKKAFVGGIAEKLKKVMKWNFITLLEEKLEAKSDRAQNKKEGSKKKLAYGEKLQEANFAGTKEFGWCRLFITEGLSAKAFADRYISKLPGGTDYYGSFALRGKFINAQKATTRELNNNEEVQMLKEILGLRTGAHYETVDGLRYGGVIFMTDQDDDGFHIEGLGHNFFYTLWPSLYDIKGWDEMGFVQSFVTMVTYTMKNKKLVDKYHSNPDFENWYSKQTPVSLKGVTMKYLKGLGSHKPGDEEYYLEDPKIRTYFKDGEEYEYMDLGFNKDNSTYYSDLRKEWITRDMPKPGEISLGEVEHVNIRTEGDMSISEFVDNILIIYHKMVLERALPSMMDGFKDSQRKVFYGMIIDPDAKKGTVGLEDLTGTIKKATGYHHGAISLENTAKGMASGYVGSNNIPLLINDGEYGSRVNNMRSAAAARYISTAPEEIARVIFDPMDEPILEVLYENGTDGKPKSRGYKLFKPIVPNLLINGADGIATGYSTNVPNYNPDDIVAWIEAWLDADPDEGRQVDLPPLVPWYRGFIGEIELLEYTGDKNNKYRVYDHTTSEQKPIAWRSKGILEPMEKKGWWTIREIPIGMTITSMKESLEYMYTGTPPEKSKKKKAEKTFISDLRWKGTTNTVLWEFKPTKDFIPDMEVKGNFKNLQNTAVLTNMHVLDSTGYPRRYTGPEDLLRDYCVERLRVYNQRKSYWLGEYKKEHIKETSRYAYVTAVLDGSLDMYQEDEPLFQCMDELGLTRVHSGKKEKEEEKDSGFNYLLSMQMRSMTVKRLEQIQKDIDKIAIKIDELETKSDVQLWKDDLVKFKAAWIKFLKTRREE
jgi:DNA topoisomerase-2